MRIRKSEFWLSKFLSVYLDVFTNNFPGRHKCSSTPDSCCKLPWESFRTTGSLAEASYAECSDRSDFMVQNLFAHGQRTRQRTGKVKTALHGTSWYSGTATQHCTFQSVACMATINYMIHAVRLQIKKLRDAERISVSCIFHSDTVPHALPRFHNPFSSVLVQFEKATVQPRTLCRLSSS